MTAVGHELTLLWPALAFLLAGVPLAALLDRLGFFDAVATAAAARSTSLSVLGLWVLAAVTTVVLNLDTTVVLLTPLYLRLARRARAEPAAVLAIVGIPLLLASLASSVLPVSNLTTLIAVEQLHLSVTDVLTHLALPSLMASTVGWLVYRRHHPTTLTLRDTALLDRRALTVGATVVAGVLVGFTFGPSFGMPSWLVALIADVVLVGITRSFPWRSIPFLTAFGVAAVAGVVAVVVPHDLAHGLSSHSHPLALVAITATAAALANVVNNLPALLVGLDDAHRASWGIWAWLLGVNTGAVLVPIGALANLLWRRFLRTEGLVVDLGTYLRLTVPVALPALLAAAVTLAIERAVFG